MKKTGILNSQLSGMIAALGHKDLVMIGDAGGDQGGSHLCPGV